MCVCGLGSQAERRGPIRRAIVVEEEEVKDQRVGWREGGRLFIVDHAISGDDWPQRLSPSMVTCRHIASGI